MGYDTKDRKITVNEAEAERVRDIFRSYLKLGSLNLLMADLRTRGIVTKVRDSEDRRNRRRHSVHARSARPSAAQPVLHWRGRFKGEILAGEQPAIVDRDLFDAVQAKLTEQVNNHKASRTKSEALLLGRIFDDRGNRMTPSHVRKRGIKYRYYISSAAPAGPAQASRHRQPGPGKRDRGRSSSKLFEIIFNESAEIADAVLIHKSCRPGRGPVGSILHRTRQ